MRQSFRSASLFAVLLLGCSNDPPGDLPDAMTPEGPCATDCAELDDACHFGVCDEVASRCVAAPRATGTPCDDANVCTTSDVCAEGTCAGTAMDGPTCVLDEACATSAVCTAGVCVGAFAPATTCDTAVALTLHDGVQRIEGTLDCVSTHHRGSCGGDGSERVYRIALATPRRVRITPVSVEGGAGDVALHLRDACEVPTSERACSTGVLEASLPAGEHVLVVDGVNAESTGAFAIDVDVLEPDACPEEPEIAIPIRAGDVVHVRGDTTGEGAREFPTYFCNPTSSPDHVYRFVVTETSVLRFRGESSTNFDAYITVLSGPCTNPTAVACNDDSPTDARPLLEHTFAPGEYHLVVTGVYAMNWGQYDIAITRL